MNKASDKRSRILETAIQLAEQGGFENVRLRDVAANASVALGTLYKRFPSKESILVAALEREVEKLEQRMARRPASGQSVLERVLAFFETATRTLFKKPNLSRAVLRALTSGDAELTGQVAAFHQRMTAMIVSAMHGPDDEGEATNPELMVAFILQHVWFSSLVGWMGGLIPRAMVIEQLRITLTLLLRGMEKDT
jgi:AcrR family transcriptional regulator